MPIQKLEHN